MNLYTPANLEQAVEALKQTSQRDEDLLELYSASIHSFKWLENTDADLSCGKHKKVSRGQLGLC